MIKIKESNSKTDDQSAQKLNKQLESLLSETGKVIEEIDQVNLKTRQEVQNIGDNVAKSIKKIEAIQADLDAVEAGSSDELDRLILEQAADAAEE